MRDWMLGKHLPIKHRCCAERRPIVPRNPTFTSESRSLAVTRAQSSLNYATNPRYSRSFVESLPLPFRNEQKKNPVSCNFYLFRGRSLVTCTNAANPLDRSLVSQKPSPSIYQNPIRKKSPSFLQWQICRPMPKGRRRRLNETKGSWAVWHVPRHEIATERFMRDLIADNLNLWIARRSILALVSNRWNIWR